MDGRIFYIKNLIVENLNNAWTVEKMARIVDLSPSHFHRLFKNNVGIPPMVFLNELRLDKARDLLHNSFLQIKQIRLLTGLNDDSHFARDFKLRFGMTPTECRNQYWEQIRENATNVPK